MSRKYKIILKVNDTIHEEIVLNDHSLSISIMVNMHKEYFNRETISSNVEHGIVEMFFDNGHLCHYHVDDKGKLFK